MHLTKNVLLVFVGGASVGYALPQMRGGTGVTQSTGSGPYAPGAYFTDDGLTTHTFYQPKTVPAGVKMPVLVWAESGCAYNGRTTEGFLNEIASHGFLVIANGPPNGGTAPANAGSLSNPSNTLLKAGLTFIAANAGKGKFAQVDATKIAAAGHSCGGLETYAVAQDERVTSLGIFSSGMLDTTQSAAVKAIVKPIFYFIGGPTDVAYPNAERDWPLLPASTPKWKGNMNVGHGETFNEKNGGKFAVAAVRFLQFTLQGNTTAGQFFIGSEATAQGWNASSQSLDKIKTTALLV